MKRTGHPELWHGERRRTSALTWAAPLRWNREARATGVRRSVFCASLADVFDNQVPDAWRNDLWALIFSCRSLDWLLLTKRPQNFGHMLPAAWGKGWSNVWLGVTAENQAEAGRRIPILCNTPARHRFLSCEPLLGPVDLTALAPDTPGGGIPQSCLSGRRFNPDTGMVLGMPRVDWVIAGGESGGAARPAHPDWIRSLRDQCAAETVPFFFKQWGEWRPFDHAGAIETQIARACSPVSVAVRPGFLAADGALYRNEQALPALLQVELMERVGKTIAGARLDGCEYRAFPEALRTRMPPEAARILARNA
jgi:protein gp37